MLISDEMTDLSPADRNHAAQGFAFCFRGFRQHRLGTQSEAVLQVSDLARTLWCIRQQVLQSGSLQLQFGQGLVGIHGRPQKRQPLGLLHR